MIKEKAYNAVQLYKEEGWKGVNRVSKYYIDEWKKRTFFIRQSRKLHLITKHERVFQKKDSNNYTYKFSILTPLYNTAEVFLNELYVSLRNQTYSNWELCLADASDPEHDYVGKICKRWQASDSRIIYKKLDYNGGISENTNQCFALATGDYCGLLDHDDVLHESALYYMARYINETNADFLYSDEAKFRGRIEDVTEFVFKNGFGPDELRSHNYICHFTVFSRVLAQKTGLLFRKEFDGSQDHDLVLRLTERARKIKHVPKVLYYWRLHNESVSMNLDSKSYAVDSAIHAIEEQLVRQEEVGTVCSNLPYRTVYRISYNFDKGKKILIIIHGFTQEKEYLHCRDDLLSKMNYRNITFAGINSSDTESFGEACNRIIKEDDHDYILLWHFKCRPNDNKENAWLDEMMMHIQRKYVICVGPKVLYNNDSICHAGTAICKEMKDYLYYLFDGQSNNDQGYEAGLRFVRNVTALWAGCCMIDGAYFQDLNGFDECMIGYELVDLCLRARKKGLRCVWTCFSEVVFQGSEEERTGMLLDPTVFEHKWDTLIERRDPYLHPVLRELKLV